MTSPVRADIAERVALFALLVLTAVLGTAILWRDAERRTVDHLRVVEVAMPAAIPEGTGDRPLELPEDRRVDLQMLRGAIERASGRRMLVYESVLEHEASGWPLRNDDATLPVDPTVADGLACFGEAYSPLMWFEGRPTWVFTRGEIVLSTPDRAAEIDRYVAFYDVRDMIDRIARLNTADGSRQSPGQPQRVGGFGSGGIGGATPWRSAPRDAAAEELIDFLTTSVEPWNWELNGGLVASIRDYSGLLIVNAPPRMHREVEALLRTLEYQLQFD